MTVDPVYGDFAVHFPGGDDRRGLLVVVDDAPVGEAQALAQTAGLRLLDVIPLRQAPARLEMHVGADIVMLFCQRRSMMLERLIVQIEALAIRNNMAVILVTALETVDLVYATMRCPRTQLLCNPDNGDIAAALRTAADSDRSPHVLHEAARERASAQQIGEQHSQLARTIEALGGRDMPDHPSGYVGLPAIASLVANTEVAATRPVVAQVLDLLRARRMRADFLPGKLFADPAWDMMLDLFAARLKHQQVSVSSLCMASGVPPTSARRWIDALVSRGLFERQADPNDGRRIFISLADEVADNMARWFRARRQCIGN